jgi:hypothetical protein
MVLKEAHPIKVGAVFGDKKKIRPVWFVWEGNTHRIKEITYTWSSREGHALLYHFSITDGADNLYELCYRTDSTTWHLLALEESN